MNATHARPEPSSKHARWRTYRNAALLFALGALPSTVLLRTSATYGASQRQAATECWAETDYIGDYTAFFNNNYVYSQASRQNTDQGGTDIGNNSSGPGARPRWLHCPILDTVAIPGEEVNHAVATNVVVHGRDFSSASEISVIGCVAAPVGVIGDFCGTTTFSSNASGGSTSSNTSFVGGFALNVDLGAFSNPTYSNGYAYLMITIPPSTRSNTRGNASWVSGYEMQGP